MARKKKIVEEAVKEDIVEVAGDINVERSNIVKHIKSTAVEEEVVEAVVEKVAPAIDLPPAFAYIVGDYAKTVGEAKAINLLRVMLRLGTTSKVDSDLKSAIDQYTVKYALIDDYQNARDDDPHYSVATKAKILL